jgi:hypothetical protein
MTAVWRFIASPTRGELTGPVQKFPKSQINVLRASMCNQPDRGLLPAAGKHLDRSHSAVCTEAEIWKGGIGFLRSDEAQAIGLMQQSPELEFKQSASIQRGGDGGLFRRKSIWEQHRIGRRRDFFPR